MTKIGKPKMLLTKLNKCHIYLQCGLLVLSTIIIDLGTSLKFIRWKDRENQNALKTKRIGLHCGSTKEAMYNYIIDIATCLIW